MKHRPDLVPRKRRFICPECNQKYKVAGGGPGGYWEEYGKIIKPPLNQKIDSPTIKQTNTWKKIVKDVSNGECLWGWAFIDGNEFHGNGGLFKGLLKDHHDGVIIDNLIFRQGTNESDIKYFKGTFN